MRILLLLTLIYPIYNNAMEHGDKKGEAKSNTTFMEIPRERSNNGQGESPDPRASSLKKYSLGKSVSPERARTPSLTFYTPSRDEHAIREQLVLIHGCMFTLEQRVVEILTHAREDNFILGSEELSQRFNRYIKDEESLLELLYKSPSAAELAGHLLKEPKDTALAAWKAQTETEIKVDQVSIKARIKDVREEIIAARIALYISEKQQLILKAPATSQQPTQK